MTLDEFYPYILAEVQGCPDPTININLVAAAIEFCTKSLAWSETTAPIALVNTQANYVITAPSDSRALMPRDVWLDGSRLVPKTVDELAAVLPNWPTATGSNPAYYNASVTRGSIRVYPTPASVVAQALLIRAAYIPTPAAQTLPDFLGHYHMEAIASGAKARLMATPTKDWFNPELGLYHRGMFDAAIIDAKNTEAHDRVQGSISVVPRRFGQ